MLNSNEMVNNDDVDDEIIPPVPEFRDASGFSFIVFNDWALSHKCISGGSDLEVRQTFSSKNKLVNVVNDNIAHLVKYRVERLNSTFVQLQCVQALECKLTLVMNKLSIMAASIQDEIKLHYKYNISYEKAWVPKQKVIKNLIGSHEESFQKLPRLLLVIKESNPETVVN